MLCNEKYGAPIQCDEKKCYNSYHPLCCRKRGLKMTYDDVKVYILSLFNIEMFIILLSFTFSTNCS